MTAGDDRIVRVASYNVHACVGRDGRFMPERVASVMQELNADFLALQEVDDRIHRGASVSEFFAARLGMHAYRGSTLRREDSDYGNLLLAKQQAVSHRLHDISVAGGEPRGAIEADFECGDRRVRILVTHLGLRAGERFRQVRQLMAMLEPGGADVTVLAGDINEWRPASAPLRALRRAFGARTRGRTFPSAMPLFSLDRICVSPAAALAGSRTVTSAKIRRASDHLPLVCDLSLD